MNKQQEKLYLYGLSEGLYPKDNVAIIFNIEELKIIKNQLDTFLREIEMSDNAITAQSKIINGMKELGGK